MLRRFLSAAALAVLALWAAPARANDLMTVYRLALEHDQQLRALDEQRAAAVEAAPQARAALLPRLEASAGLSRDRLGYEAPQTFRGDVKRYGFALSQTVWSLEAFQHLKAANREAAEAELRYRGEHLRLALRVAQAYFRVLSAADQLATRRAERDAFGTLLAQARGREQTGVGPRSDVVQAQSFYDATGQGLIDAQTELEDAAGALQEITGSAPAALAPLREEIALPTPEPASADEWVRLALAGNLELQAREMRADSAAHQLAAVQARHLPVVELRAVSTRLDQDLVLGGREDYDGVGLQLTWPLFQGGGVASEVRAARAAWRAAQAEHELVQRQTERLVRLAYRGAATGLERVAAAERAVRSSREAVEQSRRDVEFGTGTEFELLSAQNDHYSALRAWQQARFDQLTHALALEEHAGRLDERDLEQVDSLLAGGTP